MEGLTKKLPFGHSKEQQPSQKEDTLATLLTADQCADLTFLIATTIAAMRQSLLDTFTAAEPPLENEVANKAQQILSGKSAASTDDEKDKLRKAREKREEDAKEELAQPEVQELKKAMLHYFDEWRGKIIVRIGEIVNSRDEATQQSQHVPEQNVQQLAQPSEPTIRNLTNLDDKSGVEAKVFKQLYPALNTELTKLPDEKRALVLRSLLLVVLSLESYSAHSRILLLHLASSLGVRLSTLKSDEETIARGLLEAASHQLNADAETKKAADASSTARKWKVGLAGVAGAALIGVTGGLAAPLLAAGIGSVMGGLGLGATAAAGYLGTLASSSVLVGGLFGAYGAKMTSKAMEDYARQVEDFGFIPVHHFHRLRKPDQDARRLRVSVAISGWLTSKEEVVEPWRYIDSTTEGFALRWELEALLKLGNSLDSVIKSTAWAYAKGEIIKRTVFGALSAGLWPLSLLKISSLIDNPFSVAKFRADRAGKVLAEALINKVQGERPVTLIGYSLGARLIYSCLKTLAARKAFGLIENVAFLGTPCPSDAEDWRPVRSVVSGRVVNVFSENDYILAFLYRTSSVQLGIAGLQPILGVHGVENVDVSSTVPGHLAYRYLTGSILAKIGFEDVDLEEVQASEEAMQAIREEERKEQEKDAKKNKTEEQERADLEREVEKRNEQSMLSWAKEKMNVGTLWDSGRKERTEAEKMVELEKRAREKEGMGEKAHVA